MGLPESFISALQSTNDPTGMALYHSLLPSAEKTRYNEHAEKWAPSSGALTEETTAAQQIGSLAVNAGLTYGAYKYLPRIANSISGAINNSTYINEIVDKGPSGSERTIKDVLNIDNGKRALKEIRKNAFTNVGATLSELDYSTEQNFWYSGLTRVGQEGTGLGLPIFDDVIKLFTRATYLADILSYSVKRESNRNYFLNISSTSLGATGRADTLDFYARVLNPFGTTKDLEGTKKRLSLIDYLVYRNGNVYAGELTHEGEIIIQGGKKAQRLNKEAVRLVDKGRATEAALILMNPKLGVKNRATGATLAEAIGGADDLLLMPGGELDPQLGNILDNLQGMIPGGKLLPEWARFRKQSNLLFMTESYATMALARTSDLITELYNEAGSFLEYLAPKAKKNLFAAAADAGLAPRIQHGQAMTMLGRYSRLGMTTAAVLTGLNQLGYSMQHGGTLEREGAGIAQTAGLAYLGGLATKKLFDKSTPGLIAGMTFGIFGMAGMGPFAAGPIPGAANLFARANEIRAYAGEITGMSALRRSFNEMMPGSTDFTTALGIGAATGTALVTLGRYLAKDTVVEEAQRAKYLEEIGTTIKQKETIVERGGVRASQAGRVLDSLPASVREEMRKNARKQAPGVSMHQVEREISRNRRLDKEDMEAFEKQKVRMSQADQTKRLEELKQAARNRRGMQESKLSNQQIERVEEEILTYTKKLRKKKEFSALNNAIGKVSTDSSNFVGAAARITKSAYEGFREKLLKENKSMYSRIMAVINYAPRPKAIGYAAAAIGGLWYAVTSGAGLGSIETPQQLRELNQGKRLEAVRRSQKWEMGQGAYEGDDILFFRPTLTARLSSGAMQQGSSGRGPISEFLLKNFTYKLERENYYSKPAPITGAAFDQVPFIYPFIQPLTDLIKRPKLMHIGEWARVNKSGTPEFLERTSGLEETPQEGTGGLGMAAPYSPYAPGRVIGKFWQQTTALSGLVGYYARTVKGMLTGTKGFSDQRSELESASQSTDLASKFYDLHGGGSFLGIPFTSEVIRRFLHKNELTQYNPIQNNMPSWMPENLKFGNPVASLRGGGGEYRTPGKGYEAMHKELSGLDPENYPLLHKLNILGDLAPYSSEYRSVLRQAELMKAESDMTDQEISFFYKHKQMMKMRKEKRKYDSYTFKPSTYDTISGTIQSVDPETMSFTISGYGGRFGVAGLSNDTEALISDFNLSQKEAAKLRQSNIKAFTSKIEVGSSVTIDVPASIGHAVDDAGIIKGAIRNNLFNVNQDIREEGKFAKDDSVIANYSMTNIVGRTIGRVYEAGTHFANRMFQPLEHMMAFGAAPVNKLLPYRDALEDYEAREMYGTEMKSWEEPIGSWIAPAIKTAMHNYLGLDFEAPSLSKKRQTEEYFDKLKYFKYSALTKAASEQGQAGLALEYQSVAQDTAFGGSGWVDKESIGKVLGGREAMFAMGFANELNPSRQEAIIEALPDFKEKLMRDFYLNQDREAISRAASAGPMSQVGMDYLVELNATKRNQGYDPDMPAAQVENMREEELSQYFKHRTLPKVDWIGFNPAVDLEDVKLKYIENEGMDYHDFGIYPSRASYLPRKPYLDEASVQNLNDLTYSNPIHQIGDLAKVYGVYGSIGYNIQGPNRNQSFVDLTYNNNIAVNPFEGL